MHKLDSILETILENIPNFEKHKKIKIMIFNKQASDVPNEP